MPDLDGYIAASARADLPRRLKLLDELLQTKGIDLAALEGANVKRLNFWQGFYKDAEGESQKVDMAGIVLSPAWEEGPEWPIVQPGPALKLPPRKKPRRGTGWATAVVLPDIQGGFWRDPETGELVPTHDEQALEIALAIIADEDPDEVVMHGDNFDFPELSRYRKHPTFAQTTQATVNWGTEFYARVRAAAPGARIRLLAGNHEERLPNYIIDNATAAFGLKRPGDQWPLLSVPTLCRLDDSGVEFVPGYPANEIWLNDRLRVIHGHKVNSRGSTANRYLEDERVSVLYGHVHRREWGERTSHTRKGPRMALAASFGCLCRIDGTVPGVSSGQDLSGRPLNSTVDWQQGLGVVRFQPGEGRFSIEPVAIHDGWALHRGQEYSA